MSAPRPVVLKFGSSVLDGSSGIARAAERVLDEARDGRRVCAVVSALPRCTDTLWAAAHTLAASPRPDWVTDLMATGEHASMRLLAIALQARGLATACLDARALALRTRGPVLDAEPERLDRRRLDAAWRWASAVVVPGFVGVGARGELTLLGRGGSDLTALAVAHAVGAECVLIKDVDGLYEADPGAASESAPRRYVTASWNELMRVGGQVVQPKAVAFARERRLRFHISSLRGTGTAVGPLANTLAQVAS